MSSPTDRHTGRRTHCHEEGSHISLSSLRSTVPAVLAMLLTLVTLGACGGSGSSPPSPSLRTPASGAASSAPSTTFASDKYGFSVSYAPGWERQEGVAGAVVAFLTAKESDADTFRDNVTVVVQSLPQGTTLQDYLDKSLADLPRFLQGFHMIEQQSSTLGGLPARTLHYTGETSGVSLENRQVFAVAGERAYLITYSAQPDSYDRFLGGAQQIFDTFELTGSQTG